MNRTRSALFAAGLSLFAAAAAAQVPQWTPHSDNAPGPRYGAGMCSLGNGSLLLFGGDSGSGRLGDTWRYDTGANTWTQVFSPQSPSPRRWHAMTLHEATGEVLLHGGQTATGDVGDTWVFAGGQWVSKGNAGPSARSTHALAHDRTRARSVLFGGSNLQDTWEWNGFLWVRRLVVAAPSPRTFAGMVFDERSSTMFVVGGSLVGGAYSNEVWGLGSNGWIQWPSLPVARAGAELAYDRSRHRVVLFGGLQQGPGGITASSNVFERDAASAVWVQRTPLSPMPARYGSDLAYVPGSGIWVFGGSGFGPVHGDLRRYSIQNGASYTQTGPGCGAPALVPELDSLPWLGETFVRVSQLPQQQLVLLVTGFAPNALDLAPIGVPGCLLGSTADVLTLLALAPQARLLITVPATPALNGVELFEQIAVLPPSLGPVGVQLSPTMRIRVSAK
jgi:hypothetical protein